jgi:phosphocarrier protein
VEIRKGAHTVSGKSIMGILGLAMPMGDTFEIIATGEDADKALDRLRALVADRFGEEV